MNKPVAPKKPLKHAAVPNELETVRVVVMRDYKTKELYLVSEKYRERENREKECPQYELDNLEDFGDGMSYLDVIKFKKLLPPEIENFEIDTITNYDGYYSYTILVYKQPKNPAQYQQELNKFNNRFQKYEKNLAVYREELKVYEAWRKEEKIKELQAELAKIS